MNTKQDGTIKSGTKARDPRMRSLLKAISYRVIGTLTTAIITYAVTGNMAAALTIGAIEPVAKILLFYFHERAWQAFP